jgi:hypothetical protein
MNEANCRKKIRVLYQNVKRSLYLKPFPCLLTHSNMKKILTTAALFSLLFCTSTAFAQLGMPSIAGAAGAGAGDASVAYTNINSAIGNQAGLAFLEKWSATAFYESRFGLADAAFMGGAAAIPLRKAGIFGLTVNSFGKSDRYAEQKLGLAYARKLAPNFSIGGQLDYVALVIPQYGNKSYVTFELGLLAQVMPKLKVGVHAYSPIRQRINETEYIPTVLSAGAAYEPNKKCLITAEYEQDMRNYPVFKAGVDYRIAPVLAIRLGIGTSRVAELGLASPARVSGGFSLYLSKVIIDMAAQYHSQLGYTPSVGLRWQ